MLALDKARSRRIPSGDVDPVQTRTRETKRGRRWDLRPRDKRRDCLPAPPRPPDLESVQRVVCACVKTNEAAGVNLRPRVKRCGCQTPGANLLSQFWSVSSAPGA